MYAVWNMALLGVCSLECAVVNGCSSSVCVVIWCSVMTTVSLVDDNACFAFSCRRMPC